MFNACVISWVLMVLVAFPPDGAAESVSPKEPPKEPPQAPAELKKKADAKPDAKPAEDKPSAEGAPQEPKKKGEPDLKPESKPAPPDKPAGEPPGEPKKKTETDRKADAKNNQDGKPATEPPAAPPKPEEPAKKPVTSLNLTIKLALLAEPSLFPFDIEVEVDKQKATVRGAVPSEDDKVKAGQIAKTIEGVDSVVNKLTVDASVQQAWEKKQDEAITQLVKERLNRSETLKAVGFEVKSEHGIVALSGKTHYQVIALEAAEAARHVPGVRAVTTAGVQLTAKD